MRPWSGWWWWQRWSPKFQGKFYFTKCFYNSHIIWSSWQPSKCREFGTIRGGERRPLLRGCLSQRLLSPLWSCGVVNSQSHYGQSQGPRINTRFLIWCEEITNLSSQWTCKEPFLQWGYYTKSSKCTPPTNSHTSLRKSCYLHFTDEEIEVQTN